MSAEITPEQVTKIRGTLATDWDYPIKRVVTKDNIRILLDAIESAWRERDEAIAEVARLAQPSADVVMVSMDEYKALESVRYHAQEVAAGIREMGPSRLSEPLEHALERLDALATMEPKA